MLIREWDDGVNGTLWRACLRLLVLAFFELLLGGVGLVVRRRGAAVPHGAATIALLQSFGRVVVVSEEGAVAILSRCRRRRSEETRRNDRGDQARAERRNRARPAGRIKVRPHKLPPNSNRRHDIRI